jgi:uncharacterized protein (DUF934 family)
MTVMVTDTGFGPDTYPHPIATADDLGPDTRALDLAGTDDPAPFAALLPRLTLIRITFAAFNDGRGFTLGTDLRRRGFTGTLRARGPLLADQYAMLRRAGFDEVEIPDDIAARQPADQWQFRADWQAHDHRARLFA